MKFVGVICEYNPFHLGHKKQFDYIRTVFGEECAIVCLMSGNFVQRGQPAIFDKSLRAEAALKCGADLVLELPVQYALSSAESFAAGGVQILGRFCDYLCFGSENGTEETLMATARALLSAPFSEKLRLQLDKGLSFPAARQAALEEMELDSSLLISPNDILAVEYCKAILAQSCTMKPLVIRRKGDYHADTPDAENPSATSLRALAFQKQDWLGFVPQEAREILVNAPVHSISLGERAILARLRTMTDAEFEALPYGSEGLWRKLMHASRSCGGLEEILAETKSKRYTRSRLDRMVMCAFLGLTAQILTEKAPYVRVLGFRSKGTDALKLARKTGDFPHIGEKTGHTYEILERRCDDLYGLFRAECPEKAGMTQRRRVCIVADGKAD
ncbi:MAG: nucleotidyltransferase family protein [Oscillospiraceae bacterium]|nr:nucleotidyltransferase family protein [Oscillospiraceae bacterium]